MSKANLNPIQARLTATLTAIAGLLGLVAVRLGFDLPAEVAASIVAIVAMTVSAIAPRWAEARGILLDAHPAALTAAVVALLVWLSPLIGVDLSETEAIALVSGLTAIVGSLTPRAVDRYPYNMGKEWSQTHEEAERDHDPESPPQSKRRP